MSGGMTEGLRGLSRRHDSRTAARTRRPALFLQLPVFVAGVVSCIAVHGETQRELWNKATTPFRVIDNIYYVGTNGLGAWLIATPAGHILLDAALPESAPLIEANIRALGFRLSDVRYLLNSHAHFDHSGGLAQIKRDTGAHLIASEGDRSALEGGVYLGSEDVAAFAAPPVRVDRVVSDGDTVSLGGVTLTANVTPGHTRGCTSWSMPVADAGRKLQVLFFCSSSVAANRLVGRPQYEGIVADYEKTFARAQKLRVDVFLAGHPEFFDLHEKRARMKGGGPSPFIDSAEFHAYMQRSQAEFRRQLAAQQAASAGRPVSE
jgi:metallo-beta-lactamase class B